MAEKKLTYEEERDRLIMKKLACEIRSWLEHPPETLSWFKKFYDSIISIWLGGEGLKGSFHKKLENGVSDKQLKEFVRIYKTNYPNKKK